MAKRSLIITLCLLMISSIIGCQKSTGSKSDAAQSTLGGDNNAGGKAISSNLSEEELLAVKYVEAVRDMDYETIIGMTDLCLLAPQAPPDDSSRSFATIISWRCSLYVGTASITNEIHSQDWIRGGLLDSSLWGRTRMRENSECVGIADNSKTGDMAYVTVAVEGKPEIGNDDPVGLHIKVGLHQDSQGIWSVAPIDIYPGNDISSITGDNDRLYFYVDGRAVVSINGTILEPETRSNEHEDEGYYPYSIRQFYTGAPIVVDVDYGYMKLQDWVSVYITTIDNEEVAIAYTNTGGANGRTQWEIPLLELTQPEGTFDFINDEVTNEAISFTTLIQKCLNNGDYDGFMQLLRMPRANIWESDFVSDDWDEKDSREITVTDIRQLSPASSQYINPMDINIDYSDDDDPLTLKSDFILSLCELIIGGKTGLEPVEKTIIDRCVRLVYRNYLVNPSPERMPMLQDLYDLLREQVEPEAQRIATALEIYVTGSLNVFNHRTNVDITNRLQLCYSLVP